MTQLLGATPGLRILDNNAVLDKPHTLFEMNPITLHQLTYLSSRNITIEQIISFYQIAPIKSIRNFELIITDQLLQIYNKHTDILMRILSGTDQIVLAQFNLFTDMSLFQSKIFRKIRTLGIGVSFLTTAQLEIILKAFPNIEFLVFNDLTLYSGLLKLSGSQLKCLTVMTLIGSGNHLITDQQLCELITAAPNLNRSIIELPPTIQISEHEYRSQFPNINFTFSKVIHPKASASTSTPNHSLKKPDGQLKHDSNKKITARTLFINHRSTPPSYMDSTVL